MLTAGTVSVDDDGNATGSGLALALYNAGDVLVMTDAEFNASGFGTMPEPMRGQCRANNRVWRVKHAAVCTAQAAAIVSHFQANGVAVAGVNSLASGVPSSPVQLPIL